MSSWFTIEEPKVSEDKKAAVFRVQNSTLEPLRAQAAAAAVEMAGAPFDEPHFRVDPATFGLEPGESREVTISLADKAPQGRELPVRLRVEKAELPDHFVFSPGVTLGKKAERRVPPWVWFAIGGGVLALTILVIILVQTCGRECKTNADCGSGFACSQGGQCLCGGAETCPTSTPQCYQATCRPLCSKLTKNSCAHGERCDAAAKVCVPGCDDAADCDDGFTCKDGACVCGDKAACPEGTSCVSGQCQRTCKPGQTCPSNMICNDKQVCVTRCDSNLDCPKFLRCNMITHMCSRLMIPIEGTNRDIDIPQPIRELDPNP